MSGSLRDLVVSIDFDDINISNLLHVDSAMDEIERQFTNMGANITDASQGFNHLGSNGSSAMNEISSSANHAENATNDVGQEADNSGNKFGALGFVGAKAFAAIAAGATTAYGAIVAVVMESQSAFDRLEAKTGETGASLAGLEGVATNVFNGAFGESLTAVTDDVAKLNSMFKDLNDEQLQNLAEGAYTISDLWGPEVGEVGTVVKNMTGNFKKLSEQDALDLLTVGFQKTGDYSDDLMDTMKEYSPLFAKLGLSAKDSMGILIKGAEAGAWNMDKIGDAAKEFGIRGMDGSKASADGYKLIGLSAKEMTKKVAMGGESAKNAFAATLAGLAAMKDPVKQNAAGVALFGTQWEDVRADVILSMQDSSKAVGDFKGKTDEAADAAYDNFGSRMTSVFRKLKTKIATAFDEHGGEELFDTLATKAEELVPKIEELVGKAVDFANAVKDNWPAIRETTIGIATAVGTFSAIMGGLKIIGIINTLMVAFRTGTLLATLAQYGLNTAMLANPVTWVVAGIAALVAIGVVLYRNWDTVKAKTEALWNKLGAFKGVATAVLGPLGFIIRAAVTMADNWDSTKGVWENVWNGIKIAAANSVNDVIGSINKLIGMINKIPGVNVPIIPKVEWGNVNKGNIGGGAKPATGTKNILGPTTQKKTTFNDARTKTIMGGISHATGLYSVPYDNYKANLHKDEAVLTARQSNALRAAGILSATGKKPKLNMGGEVAPTGKAKGESTVFAPSIKIEVNGASGDAKEIAKQAALAARKEIEKLFIQLGMAFDV